MAKIKMLIIPSVDKNTKKLDHSYIASGTIKWYSHSGEQVGSFLKHSISTTICSSSCTPGHFPLKITIYVCTKTWPHGPSKRDPAMTRGLDCKVSLPSWENNSLDVLSFSKQLGTI